MAPDTATNGAQQFWQHQDSKTQLYWQDASPNMTDFPFVTSMW